MNALSAWFCRLFHGRPMHPVCGFYRCRKCLRTWPVPWDAPIPRPRPQFPEVRDGA